MVQLDGKGEWGPTKVFPCDCGSEGVVVTIEEDEDFPYINMAFWEFNPKLGGGDSLSRWERIKYAWHILRGGSPWTAMVGMTFGTAKNLANHIVYLLAKQRRAIKVEDKSGDTPIVPAQEQ